MARKMWVVVLDRAGKKFDFRAGFFPRAHYYKADAQALIQEVEEKGGKAHIERKEA